MKPLYVKKNGVVYKISGTGIPSIYPAANVEYDNTITSELQATDVQGAIDELSTRQGGVQSDWDEDDSTELDYIKNKPQNLVQDASYVHTDNNYDNTAKNAVDSLGTASTKDAGVANGVAELDAAGKVPSSQLPSFVDDVIEVADYDHLPITGESGKIYVTLDTNKTYRWTGSGYAEISESLALGETSSTAYRGDRGKTAYDHATETKLSTATASGLYKVAATAQGHVASLTAVTKEDITGLGIPGSDTNDKVTQIAANTNANYEVLFSGTNDNTTRTEGTKKNSNLTFNPFTGLLLLNYFGTSPDITSRLTSLNFAPSTVAPGTGRMAMRLDLATSSVTEGKPLSSVAGYVHTYYWDGGAAMTQVYIPNGDHVWTRNGPQGIMIRGYDGTDAEWKDWEYIPFMLEAPTSGQVLIADGTSGKIKTSGYTIAKSVPSDAVFTDTDTKVTQNNSTSASNFRLLLSANANDTNETNISYKSAKFSANPSTGLLTINQLKSTANKSMLTGTGTAAQDKGSGVSPRYFPARWIFNTGITVADGDMFTIKIPVAGHGYGEFISVNNGTNYYPVGYNTNTLLTTHFPVGAIITVVFKADGVINSIYPVAGGDAKVNVSGGAFYVLDLYDSGNSNTYDRNRYNGAIKVWGTALVAGNVIVANTSGLYMHLKQNAAFDITYPILYLNEAVAANGTTTNTYDILNIATATTQSGTWTAYKPVFIKGQLSGTTFTPVSTAPLTQTIPTSADGYEYILLGIATATTTVYLQERHPIYKFYSGSFREYTDFGGYKTLASGENSHAEGYTTTASGKYSHAEGYITSASGQKSHAEGQSTKASGNCSHAEGRQTTASSEYSHAEGYITSASGTFTSHAEGYVTSAFGNYGSHSEGYKTRASGTASHAECDSTTASGTYSHAEGHNTAATSTASHAEGQQTTASGAEGSHAEGNTTLACTPNSHAEGYNTTAGNSSLNGASCHAEGVYTSAIAPASHAEGRNTVVYFNGTYGTAAHAEGYYTTALNTASHASGHYNAAMVSGGNYNNTTGTAFVIGNGTAANALKNAFSVQFNGVVKAASTITASTTADYAEYFEWSDENSNNEDRVGYFVTFDDGDKIRFATSEDDYILGVTSGEPFVLGNGDCDVWNGMVLRDEFRRIIYEPAPEMIDVAGGGQIPKMDKDGNPVYCGTRPKLNPNYDPSKPYINRADRPEWCPVGMLGVLAVRDDGTCEVNGYATITDNAIATKYTGQNQNKYRVIRRNTQNVVEIVFR